MALLLFLFLANILTISSSQPNVVHNQIHLLRPKSGARGNPIPGLSCLSWRLAVETNNIVNWIVPQDCEGYVGNYMLGGQYRNDSKVVAEEAFKYAKNQTLSKDRKNVWVFDIDETTLSNLPYYAEHEFGAEEFDNKTFDKWVLEAKAPALPESLELYNNLSSLGIKAVFITARSEDKKKATVDNLEKAGYHNWEKLILKKSNKIKSAVEYKSNERKKLEKKYRIVGNIGDQWSDLLPLSGPNTDKYRSFKLPDPMYYIS